MGMNRRAQCWNKLHHLVNAIAKHVDPLTDLSDPKRDTSLVWRVNQWVFGRYRNDLTRADLRDPRTLPDP